MYIWESSADRWILKPLGLDERAKGVRAAREQGMKDTESRNTTLQWCAGGTVVKNLLMQEAPGGGHGSPLQDSCLENPMGRGAWWATVHGVAESDTTEGACRSWWHYTNALMCSGQQNFLVLFTLPVASSADTDFLVESTSSCHPLPTPLSTGPN